jgi:hypothetical protein
MPSTDAQPIAVKLSMPRDTCSAQAHGYAQWSGCQRRGAYRITGLRGAYCAQHAATYLQRPLTDAEKAS